MCQILMLTNLAPGIQEAVLFLPTTMSGRDPITENRLRSIVSLLDWEQQRQAFVLSGPAQCRAVSSELQTIDALAFALKRAHLAPLFRQIA